MAKRTAILHFTIIILISALIFRIYYLISAPSVYAEIQANSISLSISETRAMIYDRNLVPLVSQNEKYKIAVLPSIQSRNHLKNILPENEFNSIADNFLNAKPFTFETETFIPSHSDIEVFSTSDRYSDYQTAVHFIGYCDNTYLNGISGIEKAYNDFLTTDTEKIKINYSVDASGRLLWGDKPDITRENFNTEKGIVLTIDNNIQKIAEKASLKLREKGCVVVMDVNTGEILAGVSAPTYSPNDIASSISQNNGALVNRMLASYNIGSTFKLIVCAAALSKNISQYHSHDCLGAIKIGNTDFSCHKEAGHGFQTMENALANSCNPYFISLGRKIGKERLISMSALFGIGEKIRLCDGIETTSGNLPNAEEILTDGDLANISFGQGSLMASPIHIAKIISIIANGGYNVNPTIVKGTVDSSGKTNISAHSEKTQIISKSIAEKIQKFMITTVENGTGKSAKPNVLSAGGKTASAETGLSLNGQSVVQAWFSGFYPSQDPKYAIVVLSENGKSGATACAPIFKYICNSLYQNGY